MSSKPPSDTGESAGLRLPPSLRRRGTWLSPAIDGALIALLVAMFAHLTPADPTFHAIFALLVFRAFAVDLVRTLLRLVAITAALSSYVLLDAGVEPVSEYEVVEWIIMITLVAVIAILADRREKAARHFAGLYHEATERLVTSQEEQRRELAQDLHDGVGQSVGALLLTLDSVGGRVAGDEKTAALVESARTLSSSVFDEVRGVASRLYPAIAHPDGLTGAISELAHHAGVPVDLVLDPRLEPGLLADPAETALFRIVQEALGNSTRHSQAAHVRITVEVVGEEVHAAVADDGIGFDHAKAAGRGIGLLAMEERAARAGGHLAIESGSGTGTIVSVTFPLAAGTGVALAEAPASGAETALAGSEG